ncbi:MAG: alpha/beta hydrolase [Myxococcales bacterium]|nr:alpha/beta hydrolase [Myxococcales bacterium]
MSVPIRALQTAFRALCLPAPTVLSPIVNDRGDILDPDLRVLLLIDGVRGGATGTRDVATSRADFVDSIRLVQGRRRHMRAIRTLTAGHCPARLYDPGPAADDRLLVYFHGGGWVVGGLPSVDHHCRTLAAEGQQRVLSVDYRLAPEHPFPAAVDDAVATVRWARTHAASLGTRPDRIAVAGDSAGGNLAAVACMVLRDQGEAQPAFQLLLYPATDMRRVTASHRALEEGFLLTRTSLDWYQGHYAPDIYDPRCSPLLAEQHRGLAPAIVVSAGFDPLRDDAEGYAQALSAAGNGVVHLAYPQMLHGFLQMDGVCIAARQAMDEVCRACVVRWTETCAI